MGRSWIYKKVHKILLSLLSGVLLAVLLTSAGTAQAAANIVNPGQVYSYTIMQRDIERLVKEYPDLVSMESLGQSPYGRQLWAVKLGRGESVLFLNGSHHAREWMTSTVLMKMIDTYAQAYTGNTTIAGYNVRQLLDEVSIWLVPMVNPDGVTLSQQGTAGLTAELARTLRRYNGNSTNFTRWKANMQGIDLNRQYPAKWDTIKNAGAYPWYQNYKGQRPAQAPEVQLMMDFTRKVDPEVTLSYHSSGEIIFWHFNTLRTNLSRDQAMARELSRLTGYSLVAPEKNPSGGGYKDWFIQEFGRPGFTVEIAPYAGESNVPLKQFGRVWNDNKNVGLYSAAQSYSLWLAKQQVQYLQQSMDLLAGTELYAKIGSTNGGVPAGPQSLQVIARKGDWYQVQADEGLGWIHPSPGKLAAVEGITASAELKEKVPVFKYPDAFAPKVTFLEPQTVQVTGRWGNWLLASTGSGSWWIDGRTAELKWPVEEAQEPAVNEAEGSLLPEAESVVMP
ncbi:gamma-D-glutamyl-meso-diaminopimelate peptidase [Paenibacillus sp. PK3_47]|uniref:M14 family metallopeptidase n=1 Tax=Paenibacillus sp. PK3_47 TaxID=2072642 RepID=UPI00201D9240|nr:M14 family metallocarboxypeptidase [Paenibacillus sp. PK3_47]UQZ35240.1 gamma-D-glutamyl-meso-diaminopimelate peptidase [Paenibacillus sp. PK3_47]